MRHQNLTVPSPASGTPPTLRKQASDKDLIQQGHGFFHGSSSFNPMLPRCSSHQKLYFRPSSRSSKQILQLPSHSDTRGEVSMVISSDQTLLSSQLSTPPPSLPLATPLTQQHQGPLNRNAHSGSYISQSEHTQWKVQSSSNHVQKVNQMIPTTSLPQCTDLVTSAPSFSSAMQWKPEHLTIQA